MNTKYKKLIATLTKLLIIIILFFMIDMNKSNYSSLAARDLKIELSCLIENNEYTDLLIHSVSYGDSNIELYESMDFQIVYSGYEKYSIYKSSRINKYTCTINITRYSKINNSDHIYTHTNKNIIYLGYDDNDLNSNNRAHIVPETKKIEFSESESYFKNFTQQIKDTYELLHER